MIDLYTWPTPNGDKVLLMLEEVKLLYRVVPIDIIAGKQFEPEYLKISPNNKVPAITDSDGPDGQPISLFESGAILIYLAEKSGQLLPGDARQHYEVLQWLMFQMGSIGPMLGQAHHFVRYAPEKIPYAIERYTKEANRLYGVMDRRLSTNAYLGGKEFTIADIAVYPWTRTHHFQGVDLAEYPHFKRWFDELSARPAAQRILEILAEHRQIRAYTREEFKVLWGDKQYQRR